MGTIEDEINQKRFKRATGSFARFTDIDGIGPATAKKIKSVFTDTGKVKAPREVADFSAEELAEKAGISVNRAKKAIKGGGGNPSFSNTGSSGAVSAGGIADALDSGKQKSAGIVNERRDVFSQLVDAGEEVPDRRTRSQEPETIPFYDRDTDEVRQLGQAADIFSKATADPIDPTAEPAETGFDGEAREKAAKVQMAATRVLEEREGLEYDEATSETRGSPDNAPDLGVVESVLGFGGMMTVGEFNVSEREKEEAEEEFQQQSPEARRVDKRRRAPITTDEDVYARAPGRYDFPGVDTPTQDPKVKAKDRDTVDADDTTLEQKTGSLFVTRQGTAQLEGVLPGGRSPGRGATNQAASLAETALGVSTDEPTKGDAAADITLLQRDKDGFGEELIPFGAEESDRNKFEFM